jgi:L-asparaginase II
MSILRMRCNNGIDTVGRLAGVPPEALTVAVESCGVPTFALPLRQLAAAFARFAEPVSLDSFTAAACRQVSGAMTRHPELAGGTQGRLCTEIMRAHPGTIVAKVGAEGVFAMAVLPRNDHENGLGVALKIEDGNDRAVGPVALETLYQLNLLRDSSALLPWRRPQVMTFSGTTVGELAPVFSLRTSNS